MKVLFIAYNFPPCGGPGVQRSLKFVKYLTLNKWDPLVFTTNSINYPVIDKSLLDEVPKNIKIYRGKSLDISRLRPFFSKIKLSKIHGFLNTLIAFPDTALFWSIFSIKNIKSLISIEKPSIVYTTSGPYSSHLLGLWIKKKYDLPWIVDFRDLWSENRFVKYLPFYKKYNRYLEKKVLLAADHIICVSEIDLISFSKMALNSKPVTVIHNGFDPTDLIINKKNKTKKFTILYTGNFSSTRKPTSFLKAVNELVEEKLIPEDKLDLVFAGSNLDRFLKKRKYIRYLGYVEHKKLNKLRDNADVLLLLQDSSVETIGDYSGKVFEYIASNIPILAITNLKSVVVNLINKSNTGVCVDENIEHIKSHVLKFFRKWENDDLVHKPNWDVINYYSRENSTKKLISIFNKYI